MSIFMTYLFSGVFTSQEIEPPYHEDSEDMVVRKIAHPQLKSGALFAAQAEEQVDRPNQVTHDLIADLKSVGISDGLWVYYCCWGGDIDAVATAKVNNSVIDMNSYSLSENMSYEKLAGLFKKFDIAIGSNGHFEPFVRNYWGKYGY